MPIQVQQPLPPVLGPGLLLNLHTDLGGPLPTDWTWHITISRQGEEQPSITLTGPLRTDIQSNAFVVIGEPTTGWTQDVNEGVGLATNTPVNVHAELRDPLAAVHDSGSSTAYTWDATTNLWSLVQDLKAGGGFTEGDRALLLETQQLGLATQAQTESTVTTTTGTQKVGLGSLFSWISPDFWGKTALSGPTSCERIVYDASRQNLFNITVHIDSYPETIVFRTPDNVYSFPDLAVLTIVHEGVIILRHGIHTLTHQVGPLPGTFWYGAAGVNAPLQPSDYFITVDWLEGVCGRLTGAHSPFG